MITVHSIILNPMSGAGAAVRRLSELKDMLVRRGMEYRVDVTSSPGDARKKAAQAVRDGLDGVVAVGGDGTFYEVVNGLGESGLEMLFAPCGTGHDFMRMFDMPRDMLKALEKQLDSPVRWIDLGRCNEKYFLNVTGCGFDVDVLVAAESYKGKACGLLAYLRGAYSAIKNYKPMDVRISTDGGELRPMRATIISVGNGSFIGGGMKAIPGARVDDGLFDVMLAGPVSRFSLYILLLLFAAGRHPLIRKIVQMQRCRSLRIESRGMQLESDGEIFKSDSADMSILPGALRTRLPG